MLRSVREGLGGWIMQPPEGDCLRWTGHRDSDGLRGWGRLRSPLCEAEMSHD